MKIKALPRLTVFFLFLLVLVPLSSQESQADIVVLMDTSGTMLPWFDQVCTNVLPDIAGKFVRQGDTFHIVSFSSGATFELAQTIESEEDVSRIASRFMLLYPLGSNSDILSGLNFTRNYISSLNARGEKIVIVISDGIFNPPASSPYAAFTLEQAQGELSALAEAIRNDGWRVYYIGLPLSDNAPEAAASSLGGSAIIAAGQAQAGVAQGAAASSLGGSAVAAAGQAQAGVAQGAAASSLGGSAVAAAEQAQAGVAQGAAASSLGGSAVAAAGQAQAGVAQGASPYAYGASQGQGQEKAAGASFFRSTGFVFLTVFLILLALLILIVAVAFISRRSKKPSAEINKATGAKSSAGGRQALFAAYAGNGEKPSGGTSTKGAGIKAARAGENFPVSDSEGKIMLNLFVERQNTRIGKRNIHQMKAGSRLSIGGGASSFLVFLVKFPANLAEVRYDGRDCSLAILKPEFFPHETSNIIESCLERPVTIISSKGYPVTFMLRQFEDPVVVLNRLLNSINES